jgi:hypothetical protein
MTAGAGADEDQTVHTGRSRLLGVSNGRDVVEHETAVSVDVGDEVGRHGQTRDQQWDSMADASRHVLFEPGIRLVDDLIYGERGDLRGRIGRPVSRKIAREFLDSYVQALTPVLAGYGRENKRHATIALGCTGGKHRSVAMVEELRARLSVLPGLAVSVKHRDLGRE